MENDSDIQDNKYKFEVEWTDIVEPDPFDVLIETGSISNADKSTLEKLVSNWAYKGIEQGYSDGSYIHYIDDEPVWDVVDGKEYVEFFIDLGTADMNVAADELLDGLQKSNLPIAKVFFGESIIGLKEKS